MNRNHNRWARERWEALRRSPEYALRWDWCALLRLLQCASAPAPRIGHGIRLDDDSVRLGQPPFFHPPATTVAALKFTGPREGDIPDSPPARSSSASKPEISWLSSYHFGLFGPFGPLPLHFTEHAYRRMRAKDPAFAAFCDVLHHRFLSYFFRAWADARKEVDLDRFGHFRDSVPSRGEDGAADPGADMPPERETWWDLYVGALIGLGVHALKQRDHIPDEAKLFYAGRLIQPTRNAEGLQAILEDYFVLPTQVLTFRRRTERLPQSACCHLGRGEATGRLGYSTFVGETVETHQTAFRIRLGPLSLSEMQRFLPGSDGLAELHDWVRLYAGKETEANHRAGLESAWDLQLVLRAPEVPRIELGQSGQLGWTTWLLSQPRERDAEDLIIFPPVDEFVADAEGYLELADEHRL